MKISVRDNVNFLKELNRAVKISLNNTSSDAQYIHYDSNSRKITTSNSATNSVAELSNLLNDMSHTVFDNEKLPSVKFNLLKIKQLISSQSIYKGQYDSELKAIDLMLQTLQISSDLSVKVKASSINRIYGLVEDKYTSRTDCLAEGRNKGLSDFEAECVYLYSSQAYEVLNAYLRGQDDLLIYVAKRDGLIRSYNSEATKEKEAIEKLKEECKLITDGLKEALNAHPKFSGKIYRGDWLSDEELKRMESGTYFDNAPMSFSSRSGISKGFTKRKPTSPSEKHPVFIAVEKSTKGCSLGKVSCNSSEYEVLIPPGQKFEVVMGKMEDTFQHIILKEIN